MRAVAKRRRRRCPSWRSTFTNARLRWNAPGREGRGRSPPAGFRAVAARSAMAGSASPARTAMPVCTRPSGATVSATTRPSCASASSIAAVRMIASHGAPLSRRSRIAPTAPNSPRSVAPVAASNAGASASTRPFAAPALSTCSSCHCAARGSRRHQHRARRASLVGLRAGNLHDAFPLDDVVGGVAAEFLRRHQHPDRALLRPFVAHVGPRDDLRGSPRSGDSRSPAACPSAP